MGGFVRKPGWTAWKEHKMRSSRDSSWVGGTGGGAGYGKELRLNSVGSQEKFLSRGCHQFLHLGFCERLCQSALNWKIGKRGKSSKWGGEVISSLSRGE